MKKYSVMEMFGMKMCSRFVGKEYFALSSQRKCWMYKEKRNSSMTIEHGYRRNELVDGGVDCYERRNNVDKDLIPMVQNVVGVSLMVVRTIYESLSWNGKERFAFGVGRVMMKKQNCH